MSKFAEYATSTAFHITLSKRQVRALLDLRYDPDRLTAELHMGVLRALETRGLIEWRGVFPNSYGPFITPPGEHVIALLNLAGLSDTKGA